MSIESRITRLENAATARKAFAKKFATAEEQSEYFRQLANKQVSRRIVLTEGEIATLVDAYELIGALLDRVKVKGES